MNIGIIGGGPAGIAAAITAHNNGANVTIIEHMSRIGKKLLLTGSGKCNISNVDMDYSHFHSGNMEFVDSIFKECPPQETLSFLKSLGLLVKNRNGYIYPYSEQASSVLDILRFALRDLEISVKTDTSIKDIINRESKFIVRTSDEELIFDRIIMCCGSKSYKKTGSDGSGYDIAKHLGHTITKISPALTYLNCEGDFWGSIAGIRTKAKISLKDTNNCIIGEETGELQITKTGISGIPVFNLSHLVSGSLHSREIWANIDFLPDYDVCEVYKMLAYRIEQFPLRSSEELLTGVVNKNLGTFIIKKCGIKLNIKCSDIRRKDIDAVCKALKSFCVKVISTGDFDNAQVCKGGVDTSMVKSTLESSIVSGLYFAGEILDVNGDCGGYNLTWAFCSGILAGRNCSI